jgi:hypothetical protein
LNEQNHQYGRDATIGGASVGAATYGAERSHDNHHTANGLDSSNARHEPYGTSTNHNGPRGTSGTLSESYGSHTTAGPHNTDTANKIDPRVDSDHSREYQTGRDAAVRDSRIGEGAFGSEHSRDQHHGQSSSYGRNDHYTSPTSTSSGGNNTAGPHKSDMLNKLDPRVDSDQSKLDSHNTTGRYGNDDLSHGTSNLSLGDSSRHNTGSGYGNQSTTEGIGSSHAGAHHDGSSGLSHEKKLGGAYEAGYRDALAHLEAERRGH